MSIPEDKPSAVVEVVEGVLVSGAAVSALLGVLDVEGFAGDGFVSSMTRVTSLTMSMVWYSGVSMTTCLLN